MCKMDYMLQVRDTSLSRIVPTHDATHIITADTFVVFHYASDWFANEEALKLFDEEMDVLSAVRHPWMLTPEHIVREEKERLLCFRPFSVEDSLESLHGKLDESTLFDLFEGLFELTAMFHMKKIYGYFDPAEIFIRSHPLSVQWLRLPRAFLSATTKTAPSGIFGSPNYRSPAQVQGGKMGAAEDYFVLGAMLLSALTGLPPFEGKTKSDTLMHILEAQPNGLDERIPLAMRAFLSRLITQSSEERWTDPDRVYAMLQYAFGKGPDPTVEPNESDESADEPSEDVPENEVSEPSIESAETLSSDSVEQKDTSVPSVELESDEKLSLDLLEPPKTNMESSPLEKDETQEESSLQTDEATTSPLSLLDPETQDVDSEQEPTKDSVKSEKTDDPTVNSLEQALGEEEKGASEEHSLLTAQILSPNTEEQEESSENVTLNTSGSISSNEAKYAPEVSKESLESNRDTLLDSETDENTEHVQKDEEAEHTKEIEQKDSEEAKDTIQSEAFSILEGLVAENTLSFDDVIERATRGSSTLLPAVGFDEPEDSTENEHVASEQEELESLKQGSSNIHTDEKPKQEPPQGPVEAMGQSEERTSDEDDSTETEVLTEDSKHSEDTVLDSNEDASKPEDAEMSEHDEQNAMQHVVDSKTSQNAKSGHEDLASFEKIPTAVHNTSPLRNHSVSDVTDLFSTPSTPIPLPLAKKQEKRVLSPDAREPLRPNKDALSTKTLEVEPLTNEPALIQIPIEFEALSEPKRSALPPLLKDIGDADVSLNELAFLGGSLDGSHLEEEFDDEARLDIEFDSSDGVELLTSGDTRHKVTSADEAPSVPPSSEPLDAQLLDDLAVSEPKTITVEKGKGRSLRRDVDTDASKTLEQPLAKKIEQTGSSGDLDAPLSDSAMELLSAPDQPTTHTPKSRVHTASKRSKQASGQGQNVSDIPKEQRMLWAQHYPDRDVLQVLRKKCTLEYYASMHTGPIFPLIVSLDSIEQSVRLSESQSNEQKAQASASTPTQTPQKIRLLPVFPGCLVSPSYVDVAVGIERTEHTFWIAPQSFGDLSQSARMQIWLKDELQDELPLSTQLNSRKWMYGAGSLSVVLFLLALVLLLTPSSDALGESLGQTFAFLLFGVSAVSSVCTGWLYHTTRAQKGPKVERVLAATIHKVLG